MECQGREAACVKIYDKPISFFYDTARTFAHTNCFIMATTVYYKAAKECVDPATGAVLLRPVKNSSEHVYTVGSTYVLEDGTPELCRYGFHASPHPADILLNPEFGYTVHDVLLKVDLGPETGVLRGSPAKAVTCTMTVLARILWADAFAEAGTWWECSLTLDGDTVIMVRPDGHMEWRRHGEPHRDGGLPAVVEKNGLGQSYYENGLLHREGDLPAVDRWWNQEWFVKGKRHRVGGPAVVRQGRKEEWWEHGVLVRCAE